MARLYRLMHFKLRLITSLLLLFFVLYVGLGRLAMGFLPNYHQEIENLLSNTLGKVVKIGRLEGSWHRFDPEIIVHELELSNQAGNVKASISSIALRLAFFESFSARDLRFKAILVDEAVFSAIQKDESTWSVASYEIKNLDGGASSNNRFESWIDGADIWFTNTQVEVDALDYPPRLWWVPSMSLTYDDFQAYGSGQLMHDGATQPVANFSLHADGLFSDEKPKGELYVEARSLSFLNNVLKAQERNGISFESIDASGRLWLDFDGQGAFSAQGDLQVRELEWQKGGKVQAPLTNLATHFNWMSTHETSTLGFHDLGWNWQGDRCESFSGVLEEDQKNGDQQIYIDRLDIACLNRIVLDMSVFSGQLEKRLRVSQPKGQLRDLTVSLSNMAAKEAFELTAELDSVQLDAYLGTPSAKGIDGYLGVKGNKGAVWLSSKRFELGFPELYLQDFIVDYAQAKISWEVGEQDTQIFSDGISLQFSDKGWVYGDFLLRLNGDDDEDYLGLALALQDYKFDRVTTLVPYHLIDKDLYQWLDDALVDGLVDSGVYYGYGSIEENSAPNSFTSSLFVQTNQGKVLFDPRWPTLEDLNAEIILQNEALLIEAPSAALADTTLNKFWLELPQKNEEHFLKSSSPSIQVAAESSLSESEVNYWLSDSPIAEEVETFNSAVDISGDIDIDLALDIPLDNEAVDYSLLFLLRDNGVLHKDTAFSFSDITGSLLLDSQIGIQAQDVSLSFLGEPSVFGAKGTFDEPIVLSMEGGIEVDRLLEHFALEPFPGLAGRFQHSSSLTIPSDDKPVSIEILSDMVGVARTWPSPLDKLAESPENAAIKMSFPNNGATKLDVDMDLSNGGSAIDKNSRLGLNAQLNVPQQGRGSGFVHIRPQDKHIASRDLVDSQTGEDVPTESYDEDVKGGITIAANAVSINLSEWIGFVENTQSYFPDGEGQKPWLQNISIGFDELDVFGQQFGATNAEMSWEPLGWRISAKGEFVEGDIFLESPERRMSLDLIHLVLDTSDQESSDEDSVSSSQGTTTEEAEVSRFDPVTLPELDFRVRKVLIDQIDYGDWSASLRRSEEGVRFTQLSGLLSGLSFRGLMNWELIDGEANTYLDLSVNGDDVEPFFKRIGKTPPLSSDTVTGEFSLHWPEEPQNFDLGSLSGNVRMVMSEGFLNTPNEKTGALRLMGVLNAEALGRRLRLDFSDIYKSGIGYDSLEFAAKINNGDLSLDPSLVIAGPNSKYNITGSSDLGSKELDLTMKVELPIGSNVPIAAVLLGAPQIGGAVWLIDKLLGEPLSSIASAEYDIKGTWDEPEMIPN